MPAVSSVQAMLAPLHASGVLVPDVSVLERSSLTARARTTRIYPARLARLVGEGAITTA